MGTTAVRMTVAEFSALPDEDGVKRELVDGEVFEMASGGPVHERVKGNIYRKLAAYVEVRQFNALAQCETRYHLNAIDIYQPDVSVVLGDTLDPKNEGKITIAPDLAIEVVSSETAERLDHKILALLREGTKAIVVIYPNDKQIQVHTTDGMKRITLTGTLQLDDVLPGFSVPAASIFAGI